MLGPCHDPLAYDRDLDGVDDILFLDPKSVNASMVALKGHPAARGRSSMWSWLPLPRRKKPWYMYSPPTYYIQVPRQTPNRRFRRVALITGLIALLIIKFLFAFHQQRPHHAPFETPASDLIVHGEPVKFLPVPQYPLAPFPESPMHSTTAEHKPPSPWLVSVISPAMDAARRMLIRSTWMRLYDDVPFDARFVISNPGPQWMENIRIENRTFGDMIVLDHIPEDDVTANTIKTIELYKWLIARGHHYEFVSKMDTDLWFNARGFWDRYLTPLLKNDDTGRPRAVVERTIIGELYFAKQHDLVFPHGAMYTATWDMVELLSKLQDEHNVITGEDMAVAMLMLRGREVANMINFKGTEKFDYDDGDSRGDGTAWARKKTHPNATRHAISGKDAIAVHQLKDEKLFLKVADCFDERGVRDAPPAPAIEGKPSLRVVWWDLMMRFKLLQTWTSRFDRIPDSLWKMDNGSWICDDIWRLGRSRTGYLEELSI